MTNKPEERKIAEGIGNYPSEMKEEALGKKRRKYSSSSLADTYSNEEGKVQSYSSHQNEAQNGTKNMVTNQPLTGAAAKFFNHISSKINTNDQDLFGQQVQKIASNKDKNGSEVKRINTTRIISKRINLMDSGTDEHFGENPGLNNLKTSSRSNKNPNPEIAMPSEEAISLFQEASKKLLNFANEEEVKLTVNNDESNIVIKEPSSILKNYRPTLSQPLDNCRISCQTLNTNTQCLLGSTNANIIASEFKCFLEKDHLVSHGYWIKAGLSLTAIGLIVFVLNNEGSSKLKTDLQLLFNKKSIIALVLIFGGIVVFFLILLRIEEIRNRGIAIENLKELMDLINDQENPIEFQMTEESLIRRFSGKVGLASDAYIKYVYPILIELIEKSNILRYEQKGELIFIKTK